MHVDCVEPLADTEQEDADHDERDEDGERDADLDDQRHPFGRGRGQDETVLDRHEADDLAGRGIEQVAWTLVLEHVPLSLHPKKLRAVYKAEQFLS